MEEIAVAQQRPDGLSQRESAALDGMVDMIRDGQTVGFQQRVAEFVNESDFAGDWRTLILTVLREGIWDANQDHQFAKEKLKHFDQVAEELRDHLDELRSIREEIDDESRVRVETIDRLPRISRGRRPFSVWRQRLMSRQDLQRQIARLETEHKSIRSKRQLASSQFENANQKAQQYYDLMSSVLKNLHESSQEAVKKIK